jgi:hypothetical protein
VEGGGVLEGLPPLLYAVMGIWANLCVFSEISFYSTVYPSLNLMNNTSLAGWEEGELEGMPPLLYAVVDTWANLCIFSE